MCICGPLQAGTRRIEIDCGRAAITKERVNRQAVLALLVLTCVLAYTTFQWGGVVRTGRYQYLLVLGLLAMLLRLGRAQGDGSLHPGRVLRWTAVSLPVHVLLQIIPLPMLMVHLLSPARAEAIEALGPVGARLTFASLGVFPAGTFQYFLLVCSYMVIFLVACSLTWRFRDRRWLMVSPLIGIATLEAGLGLWQHFTEMGSQVRWGTYANHNHYSGFLEMTLPFAVMYPVAVLRRARSRGDSSGAQAVAVSCVCALAGLIFVGIILSFSRMGFIVTLCSLFLMATMVLGTTQLTWLKVSRRRQGAAVGIVAALVLCGFVFLPPERLIQRFAEFTLADGLTSNGRSELFVETIPLIKAYPVFGCGLGGYQTAFSRFKISGVLITDDFAHNDYLQLLTELGFVGFVIGAVLAFSVIRVALRGVVKSSDPENRYFAVACVGALSAIALHSLADFNLYIPSNAMLLSWISGMTMSVELQPPKMKLRGRRETKNIPTPEAVEIGAHHEIYG
jgi:hypothetical protein